METVKTSIKKKQEQITRIKKELVKERAELEKKIKEQEERVNKLNTVLQDQNKKAKAVVSKIKSLK